MNFPSFLDEEQFTNLQLHSDLITLTNMDTHKKFIRLSFLFWDQVKKKGDKIWEYSWVKWLKKIEGRTKSEYVKQKNSFLVTEVRWCSNGVL